MSSATQTSRAVLRQSRFFLRRNVNQQSIRQASSTTEQAAGKAKETTSKASEGLTRVSSGAGGAMNNAGEALKKVGGRTGAVVKFVDSLIPPTVYYARVGLELGRLVFKGQNMYPPNLQTVQSYFSPLMNSLKQPQTFISTASTQVSNTANQYSNTMRNMSRSQMATVGVIGAEVLGFFTVGTMIGKMKVVGYRGGEVAHH